MDELTRGFFDGTVFTGDTAWPLLAALVALALIVAVRRIANGLKGK